MGNPPSAQLKRELADELRIIDELALCRFMGWTYDEMQRQPYRIVELAKRYFAAKGE